VRVEEDGLPLLLELLHHAADLAAADRVHAVGRLVEEDHVGVVQQRLGDPQPLLHALGVGADLGVPPPLQADHLQHLLAAGLPLPAPQAEQLPVEVQEAGAGVVVGEAVVLGEVADLLPDADRAGGLVEQVGVAVGLLGDAEQDLDERRLAGAVLAEEAVDLALLDGERHALQRLDAAVALDQALGFDDRHGTISRRLGWVDTRKEV
jgi:hypothetical protein